MGPTDALLLKKKLGLTRLAALPIHPLTPRSPKIKKKLPWMVKERRRQGKEAKKNDIFYFPRQNLILSVNGFRKFREKYAEKEC